MKKATRGRPLLRALLICEKVLQEKDNVLSAIRIIDNVTIGFPSGAPPSPPAIVPVQIVLLTSVKGGDAKGETTFQVKITAPSGKSPMNEPMEFTALFENEESTLNAILSLTLGANEEGVYHVALYVKGEREPLALLPFRIGYTAAPSK